MPQSFDFRTKIAAIPGPEICALITIMSIGQHQEPPGWAKGGSFRVKVIVLLVPLHLN